MEKKQAISLIKELSDAPGVSGFEEEVVKLVKKNTKHIGPQETDAIKNLYINRNENTQNRPVLQLDAHSDEVGFIIQAIKPNGLMHFLPLGGWIPHNISAQKIHVRNRDGDYISGVVTSKPPHFMTAEERNQPVTINELFIDVGAVSSKEIDSVYKIEIGAPVVPAVNCEYQETTDRFLGKAFDCRIGCACMIDVLDELAGKLFDFDIVASLSSQEEVGERGAVVAAKHIQSDLAIVFEGCPADDGLEPEHMIQSAMGKGPMLRHFDISMVTNPEFQKYAIQIGNKNSIPLQVSVRRGGGTNGAAINQVNGAPTIVVGIPVRYAHTHHCYIDYQDYYHAKQLVLEIINSLSQKTFDILTNPLEKEGE